MKHFSPLFGLLFCGSNMNAEVGSITATTIYTSSKVKKYFKEDTRVREAVRQNGVMVHFGSMNIHQVKGPYEVQCFFIARSGKGEGEVYDIQRQVSDLPTDGEFYSSPLIGKSTFLTTYPVEIQLSPANARTVSGTVSIYSETRGHTFGGWLIRVLEDGKVVRVEASTAEIKSQAIRDSEKFDHLTLGVVPTGPAEGRKPATEMGSSLLDARPISKPQSR
ncbi:MAG: hypothetical protein WCI46_04440 [Verrucomicrobiota bacterium]